jgi:translation initiation factor eIF-2B subunit epsilon
VICDDGSTRFEPLNNDIHPILFPLAGTPVLAFTLEFLERGGVEDIIVVCATHSTQIQSYLASSRWGETRYPVKVRVVTVASAGSVGDALREVDRLGLVKADFVLIRGGVLSNLPLSSIVEEHRKRKETDKDVMLMTMVLMQTDNESAFNSRRFDFLYSVMLT